MTPSTSGKYTAVAGQRIPLATPGSRAGLPTATVYPIAYAVPGSRPGLLTVGATPFPPPPAKLSPRSKFTEAERERRAEEAERKKASKEALAAAKEAARAAKEDEKREAQRLKEVALAVAKATKEATLAASKASKEVALAAKEKEKMQAQRAKEDALAAANASKKAKAEEKKAIEQEMEETKAVFDVVRRRYREESDLVRRFAAELKSVTNGLDESDGFSTARIASLPMTDIPGLMKLGDPDLLRLGLEAFEAQVRRLRLWTSSESGEIVTQGTPGFNKQATRVLSTLEIDGARSCARAPATRAERVALYAKGRPAMLHQAVARALFHPLTPIKRALAIHPTGTGKSLVMINVLEAYFHDPRPKVIIAPTYVIQTQIVEDMLTLMPAKSNLRRWYAWWRSTVQDRAVLDSPDHVWHVIAALSFRKIKTEGSARGSARKKHEDDDAREVAHETEDDDDMRPPDMVSDRTRDNTWNQMRKGDQPVRDVSDGTYELRAPIMFMTYTEHRLGTYRESAVFAVHKGSDPSVSFSNKIVLVDEMQNLFDEHNPNLNTVQRRKLFGDRDQREKALKGLEKATNNAERRRLMENVLIYTGMAKVLRGCKQCTLIGLTATPIVELRGDGTRAALKVLEWIRGPRRSKSSKGASSPPASPSKSGSPQKKKTPSDDALANYEGYVSYFGVKPLELFARADELSYPSVLPIVVDVDANVLAPMTKKANEEEDEEEEEEEQDAPPEYGLGRIRSLYKKYQIAKRARAWLDDINKSGRWVPPANTDDVLVDYWERSKALGKGPPRLSETTVRMPEWAEDLKPFGRSLPSVGQCAWLEEKNDGPRRPVWIRSDVAHADRYFVSVDDDETKSKHPVLGKDGRVTVWAATYKTRPLASGVPTHIVVNGQDAAVELAPPEDDATSPPKKKKKKSDALLLKSFDASLVSRNSSKCILDVASNGDVLGVRGKRTADFVVVRREGKEELVFPNSPVIERTNVKTSNLDYAASKWYYDKIQLDERYAHRLDRYRNSEGAKWMNVFYGGRELRAAQGSAAVGEKRVACDEVGGMLDTQTRPLTGFAVDMARHIVPHATTQLDGKVLWLLSEAHGLALVQRWLDCDEGKPYRNKVVVFGAYKNDDRVPMQRAVKRFLGNVFNASSNLRGERCKLIIGGAGDLGVGVTFTEVRHIFLDLTASYFNILQQMGRGERLCKHFRLAPQERTLDFHIPVPVLTTGWGDKTPPSATRRDAPGGLGSARVAISDYVAPLKVGTRTETMTAPLHTPVHAFDTLVDLQRSRVQFLAGMQTFASVAIDTGYYKRRAGWEVPRVDLASEPQQTARIVTFVRDRLRAAVEDIPEFMEKGASRLIKESEKNARDNIAVLSKAPSSSSTSRVGAQEETYRQEVARLEKKELAVERKTQKKAQKEERQALKELQKNNPNTRVVDPFEEMRAAANCRNYTILDDGLLARTDKPLGTRVDQKQAMQIIANGAKVGDPHCRALVVAMGVRNGV